MIIHVNYKGVEPTRKVDAFFETKAQKLSRFTRSFAEDAVHLRATLNRHTRNGTYTASQRYWTILPKKTVHLNAGTRLAELAGLTPMKVNALHSQAVDELGDGLRVAARDQGGMTQAVERVRDPFALGVQWHPEHLFYARRQRAIFAALVEAAAAWRERRPQVEAVAEKARAGQAGEIFGTPGVDRARRERAGR